MKFEGAYELGGDHLEVHPHDFGVVFRQGDAELVIPWHELEAVTGYVDQIANKRARRIREAKERHERVERLRRQIRETETGGRHGDFSDLLSKIDHRTKSAHLSELLEALQAEIATSAIEAKVER